MTSRKVSFFQGFRQLANTTSRIPRIAMKCPTLFLIVTTTKLNPKHHIGFLLNASLVFLGYL